MLRHLRRRFGHAFQGLLCVALLCGALLPQWALGQAQPGTLRVVTDENYPPFIFRNADGGQEGYLVDYWHLWEKKTGVHVELRATKWSEAQRLMQTGEADAIDLI